MVSKATVVTAVALGCAAGFLGGRLAAPPPRTEVDGEVASLQVRIAELETDRSRPPSLEGRPASSPAAPGALSGEGSAARLEAALLEVLEHPSPPLRAKLSELAKAPQVDKGEGKAPTPEGDPKAIAALLAGVDAEAERWGKTYDLGEGRVDELKALAQRAVQKTVDAQREGASAQQLAALDVETQAEVRRLVGDPVYTATERARITADARKGITWVAAAVGLTPAQHTQLDRLLSESVEQVLPDVIRYRTTSLPDTERAAIEASLAQRRTAGWDRFRADVLTEEQRRRLPAGK